MGDVTSMVLHESMSDIFDIWSTERTPISPGPQDV